MPNHFTVVGLFAWDGETDLEGLKGANLCEAVAPLPGELRNITASNPPARHIHKTTGEQYADCNGPMGPDAADWKRVDVTPEEQESLTRRYGAVTWFDWQTGAWGTKWGTYDTKVHKLSGDGSPVLIEFQCAWNPPAPELMRMINDYLERTYRLTSPKWIGFNPYDDSTVDIEVASAIPVGPPAMTSVDIDQNGVSVR